MAKSFNPLEKSDQSDFSSKSSKQSLKAQAKLKKKKKSYWLTFGFGRPSELRAFETGRGFRNHGHSRSPSVFTYGRAEHEKNERTNL